MYPNVNVTGVLHHGAREGRADGRSRRVPLQHPDQRRGAWAADLSEWATGLSIPVKPVKGQIVLTERLPKLLNGCLTTSDCYMAQKDNGEILIGSTTEDKGFDATPSRRSWAGAGGHPCVPELAQVNLKRTWAGLRPGSPDELPILGPVDNVEGYFNACGHFRTGILTSAITGVLLDKVVHNEQLPLDITPFLASRFREVWIKSCTARGCRAAVRPSPASRPHGLRDLQGQRPTCGSWLASDEARASNTELLLSPPQIRSASPSHPHSSPPGAGPRSGSGAGGR
jgi:hypothetical protein